ncbi:class I ribonucleotide reductase maintenance protein YfaE [Buchnera aphidicola]|uniref:class I ribonucleotide reductase maintenance protein YfaE n=1 Tax=Buchnera aphidicola TaxID=9 RepID=UPI0031B88A0B
MKIITLIYKKKIKKIYYKKKKTLLNLLKKNKINTIYQCCEGYCGICRIILIKGKIKYLKKKNLVLLNKKEILTCCCIPKTNITIKI